MQQMAGSEMQTKLSDFLKAEFDVSADNEDIIPYDMMKFYLEVKDRSSLELNVPISVTRSGFRFP